uniref:Uncharacterized protein n=1 Tax=Sus scrofa TaxID=9823 RepID=A0A8D1SYD4_PIG
MRALLGRVILVGGFFPFIMLCISCHSLLACRVSVEKSADNLIGVPLYVTCFFSLAAFKVFSLSLILVSLISMCLGVFLFGFILYGTRCASCIRVSDSFPILGKFLAIISWNIFCLLLSLFSFWHPYNMDVGAFHVVPEFSEALFICFQSVFSFLFCIRNFH